MKLFHIAFIIRIVWTLFFPYEPRCHDSEMYWANSMGFPFHLPQLIIPYDESHTAWWQINPGQVIWNWLFHSQMFAGPMNAFAGALTCVLANRIVKGSGWLLAFWPSHVMATSLVLKWIPAGLAITASWFLIRRKFAWAFLLVPANYLLFWSAGWANFNTGEQSPWFRMAGVWAPVLELGNLPLNVVGKGVLALAGLVGICLAVNWLRRVNYQRDKLEILLVAVFTVGAALTRDAAQYRLPVEPLFLAFGLRVAKELPIFTREFWDQDGWEEGLA